MFIYGVELSGEQFEDLAQMVGDCELDRPGAPDTFKLAVAFFLKEYVIVNGHWVSRSYAFGADNKESTC